jgi:hypothetical protein
MSMAEMALKLLLGQPGCEGEGERGLQRKEKRWELTQSKLSLSDSELQNAPVVSRRQVNQRTEI